MSKPTIKINDESDALADSPVLGREDDDKQQARQAVALTNENEAHASNLHGHVSAQETPRKEQETQEEIADLDLGADPLSLHIRRRARNDHRYKNDEDESTPTGKSPEIGNQEGVLSKDRKKSGSFFSRLIGGAKQKGHEDDSETADNIHRSEGVDAHVFSHPIGFIAQHPQPPKYIRVRSHNKRKCEFDRLFLAQELHAGLHDQSDKSSFTGSTASLSSQLIAKKSSAIWAMKFSRDGKYLATGGQDMIVRVWSLLSTEKDRQVHEEEEEFANDRRDGEKRRIHAPVFRSDSFREYSGHTADVLDLSWSKNNFLLSSSMDKTVRLWHVSRKECLCAFQHTDFVTAIMFHPRDDRFFLSGSLDSKLRLWSIPEKGVAYWNELSDLITAVAFTPDGRTAIAGSFTGLCLFYETEGLRYHTQIHVRSSRGRNSRGSKITGIETIAVPPEETGSFVKILVTSNDSRVRMYNLRDKTLEGKFKGYENTCSQIRASFSDTGKYVISGSEDKKVFIWNAISDTRDKKSREPYEYFQAHNAIVTVALIAPTKSRQLLTSSGDPIYDLCCPPPIKLRSASTQHSAKSSDSERQESEKNEETFKSTPNSSRNITPIAPAVPSVSRQQSFRSMHYDGNIIVTADYHGRIKVFRQDCAFAQRELSENQSILAGKRARSGMFGAAQREDSGHIDGRSWRGSFVSTHSSRSSFRSESQEEMHARHRSSSPRKSVLADSTTPPTARRASSSSAKRESETKQPVQRNMWDMATGASMTYYDQTRDATLDVHHPSRRKLSFTGSTGSADLSPDPFVSSEESGQEDEEMRCSRCGKTNFAAKIIPGGKGKTRLQCTK